MLTTHEESLPFGLIRYRVYADSTDIFCGTVCAKDKTQARDKALHKWYKGAPFSPILLIMEDPPIESVEQELVDSVTRWREHPAPVNAALVLKVAERWAKSKEDV
jgi:hypothetical protein